VIREVLLVTVAELLWAYIGPDVILPFTSVIAGIVGVVLIFWRFIVNMVKKVFGAIFQGNASPAPALNANAATPGDGKVEVNAPVQMEQIPGQVPLTDVAKP